MSEKYRYGIYMTDSNATNYAENSSRLRNGVNAWKNYFGSASQNYQAQADTALADYSDNIARAYRASMANENSIYGAGLSNASQSQQLTSLQDSLNSAFNSYVQNYASDLSSAQQNYASQYNDYASKLNTQGTNTAAINTALIDYLYNVVANAQKRDTSKILGITEKGQDAIATLKEENKDDPYYDDAKAMARLVQMAREKPKLWKKYFNVDNENELQYGNAYYLDDAAPSFLFDNNNDENAERKNLISRDMLESMIVGENNNLNAYGQQLYDFLLNTNAEGGYSYTDSEGNAVDMRNFKGYLSDTNPDLFQWYISPDAYNYTREGTNEGSIKQMYGLESDSKSYDPTRYYDAEGFTHAGHTEAQKNLSAALDRSNTLENSENYYVKEIDNEYHTISKRIERKTAAINSLIRKYGKEALRNMVNGDGFDADFALGNARNGSSFVTWKNEKKNQYLDEFLNRVSKYEVENHLRYEDSTKELQGQVQQFIDDYENKWDELYRAFESRVGTVRAEAFAESVAGLKEQYDKLVNNFGAPGASGQKYSDALRHRKRGADALLNRINQLYIDYLSAQTARGSSGF